MGSWNGFVINASTGWSLTATARPDNVSHSECHADGIEKKKSKEKSWAPPRQTQQVNTQTPPDLLNPQSILPLISRPLPRCHKWSRRDLGDVPVWLYKHTLSLGMRACLCLYCLPRSSSTHICLNLFFYPFCLHFFSPLKPHHLSTLRIVSLSLDMAGLLQWEEAFGLRQIGSPCMKGLMAVHCAICLSEGAQHRLREREGKIQRERKRER